MWIPSEWGWWSLDDDVHTLKLASILLVSISHYLYHHWDQFEFLDHINKIDLNWLEVQVTIFCYISIASIKRDPVTNRPKITTGKRYFPFKIVWKLGALKWLICIHLQMPCNCLTPLHVKWIHTLIILLTPASDEPWTSSIQVLRSSHTSVPFRDRQSWGNAHVLTDTHIKSHALCHYVDLVVD